MAGGFARALGGLLTAGARGVERDRITQAQEEALKRQVLQEEAERRFRRDLQTDEITSREKIALDNLTYEQKVANARATVEAAEAEEKERIRREGVDRTLAEGIQARTSPLIQEAVNLGDMERAAQLESNMVSQIEGLMNLAPEEKELLVSNFRPITVSGTEQPYQREPLPRIGEEAAPERQFVGRAPGAEGVVQSAMAKDRQALSPQLEVASQKVQREQMADFEKSLSLIEKDANIDDLSQIVEYVNSQVSNNPFLSQNKEVVDRLQRSAFNVIQRDTINLGGSLPRLIASTADPIVGIDLANAELAKFSNGLKAASRSLGGIMSDQQIDEATKRLEGVVAMSIQAKEQGREAEFLRDLDESLRIQAAGIGPDSRRGGSGSGSATDDSPLSQTDIADAQNVNDGLVRIGSKLLTDGKLTTQQVRDFFSDLRRGVRQSDLSDDIIAITGPIGNMNSKAAHFALDQAIAKLDKQIKEEELKAAASQYGPQRQTQEKTPSRFGLKGADTPGGLGIFGL